MRGSSEGSVAYTETVTLSVVSPDHQPKMKIAIYLWFPKQQTNKRKKKKHCSKDKSSGLEDFPICTVKGPTLDYVSFFNKDDVTVH